MLVCPFCQKTVTERAEYCPHCEFSLNSLIKLLGSPPKLNRLVNDFTHTLDQDELVKIRKLLKKNSSYRPNSGYHLVISDSLDERLPLSVHGFWLLNRGEICSPVDSGGACYDVLLLVNPARQCAALSAGYAVEYLIGKESLEEVLESQREAIIDGRYYDAMEGVVKRMNKLLDDAMIKNKPAIQSMVKGERAISIAGAQQKAQSAGRSRSSPY